MDPPPPYSKLLPGPVAAVATLDKLIAELLLTIIGYIKRANDLRQLCLVCKSLRAAAAPALYRHVRLGLEDPFARAFNRADHSGHKHVRYLSFTTRQQVHEVCRMRIKITVREVRRMHEDVTVALGLLPIHSLIGISFPSNLDMSEALLGKIARQQRTLKVLRMGIAEIDPKPRSLVQPILLSKPWTSELTNLSLRATDGSLGRSAELLKRSGMLTSLELVGGAMPPMWPSDRVHLGFWRGLLNYDDSCDLAQPLQLARLSLRQLDLTYIDRSLFVNVNFSYLVTLDIVGLRAIGRLLPGLLGHFRKNPPRLKKLQVSCHRHDSVDMTMLSDLLMLCTGLTHLSIHAIIRNTAPPMLALESLVRHTSTLRTFSYSVAEWDEVERGRQAHPCPSALLDVLLGQSPRIENLAVWLDNMTVPPDTENVRRDFLGLIRKIALGLPALKALRLLGWHMSALASSYLQPAAEIFRTFAKARQQDERRGLEVLLFQPHHDCCGMASVDPAMEMYRDAYSLGKTTLHAVEVQKADLRYDGHHYDIFDD
ncbi:hypothetical protein B0A48_15327 [Cryoendolithus antarcticus]|uniref:F-box domain-containing protein n=1 Tax=Cryoendolithus antarcticus TaxID=1507870 RepID=A0A1V8SIG5_9PEZI|nr:hypothetical protein B0A48_15327 [Cryoendolithus antarcticus]